MPDRAKSGLKRLVVKLGTSTLCDTAGSLDAAYLAEIASQIAVLKRQGVSCTVVSSGAIRAGLDRLALPHSAPGSLPIKQAAAAVGQGLLMRLYTDSFAAHQIPVAQVLLTRDDFHDRKRYVHAGNTLRALLKLGVVPIVNENDTIAVEEIKVGDNDTLAALVAGLVGADLLILLSDIDGLHTSDPNRDAHAALIPLVTDIEAVQKAARGSNSSWGTGGMKTKLEAAAICMQSRIPMIIAHGRRPGAIAEALSGETGTRFEPGAAGGMQARKRWIAGGQRVKGSLRIHEAACAQLIHRGRSLLPAGVLGVEGEFNAGDVVVLVDGDGSAFGRGIVNYDHATVREIMGKRTDQVRKRFGDAALDEVIHRDNLVVTARQSA